MTSSSYHPHGAHRFRAIRLRSLLLLIAAFGIVLWFVIRTVRQEILVNSLAARGLAIQTTVLQQGQIERFPDARRYVSKSGFAWAVARLNDSGWNFMLRRATNGIAETEEPPVLIGVGEELDGLALSPVVIRDYDLSGNDNAPVIRALVRECTRQGLPYRVETIAFSPELAEAVASDARFFGILSVLTQELQRRSIGLNGPKSPGISSLDYPEEPGSQWVLSLNVYEPEDLLSGRREISLKVTGSADGPITILDRRDTTGATGNDDWLTYLSGTFDANGWSYYVRREKASPTAKVDGR